jgi:CO/xanthine dehydrogenase Mo-binding subunit
MAQELKMIWDGGAYTEYGANITRAAGYTSGGPYEIAHMKTDSYCVYTNKPVGGPFRGFGMGELHWALEQQLDQIACKLGIDPVQIRMINACRDGSINACGEKLKDIGLTKCIEKAAEMIGWDKPKEQTPGKVRGRGIACMVKGPAMPPNAGSSAVLKINEDGSANLLITATEIGQGSMTALAQIAAEELGMSVDKIEVALPDTEYTPYEWQTVASRITYSAGNAVIRAARDAKRQLKELAAVGFGVTPEEMDVANDKVFLTANPEKYYTIAELSLGLVLPNGGGVGGPIIGRGSWVPEGLGGLDPETGQGTKAVAHWTFGCQAVEIDVDVETGKIDLVNVAAVYDIGRVINPCMAEGQTQGGIVQGQGVAFHEQMVFDENGKLKNPSFVDYKLINAVEMPRMSIHFVETPLEDGPYGARGFGEHVMVPTAPAIANALYDALGIRVKSLPMTAEKVLKAIKDKNSR